MVFHTKENIILSGFFWELKDHLSHFLCHASFVNTKERISFYRFPALKKISFYSKKSIISIFPQPEKFVNSFFILNMNFAFLEKFMFYNFSFFIETCFYIETELRNFFSLIFQWLCIVYDNVGGIRDSLK